MRHFYHSHSTRDHGFKGLLFTVPIVTLAAYGVKWSAGDPVGLTVTVAIFLGTVLVMAMCACHIFRPNLAFIEITDDRIRWFDWSGFAMCEFSYPLAGIRAIKEDQNDGTGEYLELDSGVTVRLPDLLIEKPSEFRRTLCNVAPHIRCSMV